METTVFSIMKRKKNMIFLVILLLLTVYLFNRYSTILPSFGLRKNRITGYYGKTKNILSEYEFGKNTVISRIPDISKMIPEFVSGEVIVKFKHDPGMRRTNVFSRIFLKKPIIETNMNSINELNEIFGVNDFEVVFENRRTYSLGLSNTYNLKLDNDMNIIDIARRYSQDPNVEYAEPNYLFHVFTTTPNDPLYMRQWALSKIQANMGWDYEKGDEKVVIAIVDTGVDWNHPDLADNIWTNDDEVPWNGIDDDNNGYVDDIRGWDFVDSTYSCYPGEDCSTRDNDPTDFHGHGTHCAGIAAAVTNNDVGIAGVCWNCKIMPVRSGFMGIDGNGYLEEDDVARAIMYAANNGADVISMSFGLPVNSNLIKDAIDHAYNQGVILIAASGNDGTSMKHYPAGYDNVISVAAVDENDEKPFFSNYGYWIDIAAPGVNIMSTVVDGEYVYMSGTSMSTPFVSGLAGLILSKNTDFTHDDVKQIMKSTTDPVNSEKYIGTGRINVYKALQTHYTPIARITFPRNGDFVTKNIDINGTALGDNYKVEYGRGIYPNEWTLIGSGNRVDDGILAHWDITNLVDGTYTVRLTVDDFMKDKIVVTVARDLQDGWPQFIKNSVFISSPSLGDLDNDGDLEIIVVSWENDLSIKVYAWHHDGSLVNGWPITLDCVLPSLFGSPSLGDLDNDGDLEIITSCSNIISSAQIGKVYAWHHDGSLVNGWPQTTQDKIVDSVAYSDGIWGSPVLVDLDNDGDLEIIVTTDSLYLTETDRGKIYAWHHDGTEFLDGDNDIQTRGVFFVGDNKCSFIETPAVGDVDNDGRSEIVAVLGDYLDKDRVYVLNDDGSVLNGWPQFMDNSEGDVFYTNPTLGDLDNDGDLEVVVGVSSDNSQIYAWPTAL